MEAILKEDMLNAYRDKLVSEEKSLCTVDKYMRDVRRFFHYIWKDGIQAQVTKEKVILWKDSLKRKYALTSINSMLAAVNHFFETMGWQKFRVKSLKIQQSPFRLQEKELTEEEYFRLVNTAEKKGNRRLFCLLQTLGSTGIRVSELAFITVHAVRQGRAEVTMKNKTRTVILPQELCRLLEDYISISGIDSGSIFITRSGRNMDRSNIAHEMKALCEEAGVERRKVFPHNLRHMFACAYYRAKKDLARLADVLGHSNINTTRIYTAVSLKEQEKLLSGLGLVLPPGGLMRRNKNTT